MSAWKSPRAHIGGLRRTGKPAFSLRQLALPTLLHPHETERLIQRVHKYEDLDELTPYALRELVKAIYIEAPDKSSGKRHQGIRISYDLVGFIPVEELLKQETA